MGKYENDDEAGAAKHECERNLRQGPDAQRGKELGSGPVADREHEQAEENDPEQGRKREGAKLPDQNGNDERARGGADRKTANPDAAKNGAQRDRQQQKNFRSGGDDPSDRAHGAGPPAICAKSGSSNPAMLDSDQPLPGLSRSQLSRMT